MAHNHKNILDDIHKTVQKLFTSRGPLSLEGDTMTTLIMTILITLNMGDITFNDKLITDFTYTLLMIDFTYD
jgi:hypothetical protein